MRGKKLPKEWFFQRKKHEKQGDINSCLCRKTIGSCSEKRWKQCQNQRAAQCMQQKIPKHLHAHHENVTYDLVADDDERKCEERQPSENLDALEGAGIESCMIKIYGIYRQGDGSPEKKVLPETDTFFGSELRLKGQVAQVRTYELNQCNPQSHTYDKSHTNPFVSIMKCIFTQKLYDKLYHKRR